MAIIAGILLLLMFAMIRKRVKRLNDQVNYDKGQEHLFEEQPGTQDIDIEELENFEREQKEREEEE